MRRFTIIWMFFTAGYLVFMVSACTAVSEGFNPSPVNTTASFVTPAALVTAMPSTVLPADPEQTLLQITYICNDGFSFSASGKKILVDALFDDVDGICPHNLDMAAPETIQALGGAHLVLVSHNHWDHYNVQVVGSYLLNNPETVLIAEHSAAEALATGFDDFPEIQRRVHSIELERDQEMHIELPGIKVDVINIPADIPNLCFIVRAGESTFLHSGDPGYDEITSAQFRALALGEQDIDFAFLPYWYFFDPPEQSMMVEIPARYFIPMHYAGESSGIFTVVRSLYPHAILFNGALETWSP